MCELTFEPIKHTYKLGDITLISVTQLLTATGVAPDFSFISPYYADRGRRLHEAIEMYVKADLQDFIEEDIQPYFDSYLEFRNEIEESGYESLEQEKIGYYKKDNIPLFAGSADDICMINGELALIDYKTSSQIRKNHYYQLGAYMNIFGIDNAYILQLKKDGFKFKKIDPSYKEKFLEVAEVYFNESLKLEEKVSLCKEITSKKRNKSIESNSGLNN
jgi:hypothetical protein